MNEPLKLRETETVFSEYINEDGKYVKYSSKKEEKWGFYLRFCNETFYPCKTDQEKLKNLILNATHLTIGNKDYQQPIELTMSYDTEDEWNLEEERTPTKDELQTLDRYDKKK